ncbi:hypothetical protein F8M41_017477 [Gigaspora margarita]|uniref:Uncharacterized protein n=1 Tax=Gigaspora margarita TaxID=4874 RepID=A0A8H4EM31_GIGMA|nr:hypothetical protein F8M41_017477 [Gigaspora margarita]
MEVNANLYPSFEYYPSLFEDDLDAKEYGFDHSTAIDNHNDKDEIDNIIFIDNYNNETKINNIAIMDNYNKTIIDNITNICIEEKNDLEYTKIN